MSVKARRQLLGQTQEQLAAASDLSLRTIQRIERGMSVAELTALQDEFTCPSCGAHMTEQTSVPHEYGADEIEIFACGHTRGWKWRPCPSDPSFPNPEDYDLHFEQDEEGIWWCSALGSTRGAQAAGLRLGRGRSKEEAKSQVLDSYRAARQSDPR